MKGVKSYKLMLENRKLRPSLVFLEEDTCGSFSVAQINLVIQKLRNLALWKEYWE